MAWETSEEYKQWKDLEWAGRVDYCQWKLGTYEFDTIDHEGTSEWWRGALLPPTTMAERGPCTKCANDLQNFKNHNKIVNLECSSVHCPWHEWFERQRPKEWDKHFSEYMIRRICKKTK